MAGTNLAMTKKTAFDEGVATRRTDVQTAH
jgi:hypothetical protein